MFNIDIETCSECGGTVKVIPKALATLAGQALACIEEPVVVGKILAHLKEKSYRNGNRFVSARAGAAAGRLVRLTFKLPTVQLKLLRWVAAAGYRFAWRVVASDAFLKWVRNSVRFRAAAGGRGAE